jgi:RNA polymerase sigma factor (sigma-70 family)
MSTPAGKDRFLELLDEHKKILFKVANTYCHRPADREDLVQEMVMQLWRSFGRYDARLRFSTWMYRVGLNVAISFYRREASRPRASALEPAILEVATEPKEAAQQQEELQLLDGLIRQLDELDRALVLLFLDGNRYDTIGEILGISESNVGTKIARIKQRLRQMGAGANHMEGTVSHGTR